MLIHAFFSFVNKTGCRKITGHWLKNILDDFNQAAQVYVTKILGKGGQGKIYFKTL